MFSWITVQVMLGAGAVLSNGTVLSRVGSAAVAMMAAAERIPVLVCRYLTSAEFHR